MIVEVDAPKFANEEEVTPSMYDDQLRRDLRKDGGAIARLPRYQKDNYTWQKRTRCAFPLLS